MQQEFEGKWNQDPGDYGREDPAAKRVRYDTAGSYGNGHSSYSQQQQQPTQASRQDSGYDDPTKPAPSPVIHVRGLLESATEADIRDAAQKFGAVRTTYMIPGGKRMALVEFAEMNDAIRVVKAGALKVCGMDAPVNYSTSQKVNRPPGQDEQGKPHNILLVTVLNPRYPIDVDVIHKITSPHGAVLRIVVFRKHGAVQAMVEFDSVESAVRARSYLNGADIYSGCCTLKIEYAKTNSLSVTRNDKETWDYTRETIAEPQRPPPLLEKPNDLPPGQTGYGDPYGASHTQPPRDYQTGAPAGGYDQRGAPGGYDQGRPAYDQYSRPSAPPPAAAPYDRAAPAYDRKYSPPHGAPSGGYPPQDRSRDYGRDGGRDYGGSYGRQDSRDSYPPAHRDDRGYSDRGAPSSRYNDGPRGSSGYGGPPSGGDQGGSAVAMLYGLNPEKFNCDRLFNLFCLYGNIMRIKFLKSKEGSAMVQMGDPVALRRAMDNLHGLTIFGSKIQVTASRQSSLNDVPNPFVLPDGTTSFKDYSGARNNRFTTPEQASKNRITPPTHCLHFFNGPAGSSEQEIEQVFVDKTGRKPDVLTIMANKSERSVSGFVEYENLEVAVETLILVNHTELPNKSTAKGSFPYIFKVCFTQPSGGGRGAGGGGHGGGGGGRGRGGGRGGDNGDRRGGPPRD